MGDISIEAAEEYQRSKLEEEQESRDQEVEPSTTDPYSDGAPEEGEETIKDEPEQPVGSPVMIGPHPLGGIQLVARGVDGEQVAVRLDVQEAAIHVAHMQALLTMMFESVYAQQAQAAMQAQQAMGSQGLYGPRGERIR
jgi:hypothetical protein